MTITELKVAHGRLLARDCSVGLKNVRRLLVQVVDDVGDLAGNYEAVEFEADEMHEALETMSRQLDEMRKRLEAISEGQP